MDAMYRLTILPLVVHRKKAAKRSFLPNRHAFLFGIAGIPQYRQISFGASTST
jgi:hypothetical protein